MGDQSGYRLRALRRGEHRHQGVEPPKSTTVGAAPTLTGLDLEQIADYVDSSARDNARETEGVPRGSDGWLFLRATLDSIDSISETLQSERDWRDYDHVLTRPLTGDEAAQVRKIAKAYYTVNMSAPQVRAFMRHETDVEPNCIIGEAHVTRNTISFVHSDTGLEIAVVTGKKRQDAMRKVLHNAGTCDYGELRRIAAAALPPRGMKDDAAPSLESLIESTDARYPRAGPVVDGRTVRDDVPNLSSIDGYMSEQEELPGVRVVQMADLGGPKSVFYSADDFERAKHLAEAIKHSEEINPLIVGVDEKGAFIIEGAHRFVALYYLNAREFPAVVVVGLA